MKMNGNISHDEICELIKNNKLTVSKFEKALKEVKTKSKKVKK